MAYQRLFITTWKAISADLTGKVSAKVRETVLLQKAAAALDRNAKYNQALKKIDLAQQALPYGQPSQAAKLKR